MKLFISYKNNKFLRNLMLAQIPNLDIMSGAYEKQLYKIHQKHKINSYIFSIEDLNTETLQFIEDNHNSIQFFIYHAVNNVSVIDALPQCYHLTHEKTSNVNNILIPPLVNDHIFYNKKFKTRANNIIAFIDDLHEFPKKLVNYLYPHHKVNIKIYGGQFPHFQNLGLVDETDRAEILNNNAYFLSINNEYVQEAILCGCDVYSLDSLADNKTINHQINTDYQTYIEFLTNILI